MIISDNSAAVAVTTLIVQLTSEGVPEGSVLYDFMEAYSLKMAAQIPLTTGHKVR